MRYPEKVDSKFEVRVCDCIGLAMSLQRQRRMMPRLARLWQIMRDRVMNLVSDIGLFCLGYGTSGTKALH